MVNVPRIENKLALLNKRYNSLAWEELSLTSAKTNTEKAKIKAIPFNNKNKVVLNKIY